jgi:hypothetical protein
MTKKVIKKLFVLAERKVRQDILLIIARKKTESFLI